MADLDDFFAKKDRKKNKGKKFSTTDEIARKLEETGKKVEKTKKEKPAPPPQIPGQEGEEQVIEVPEDDEWKDFEEEKKDYTGLKIGNLQISEVQPVDNDDDGEDDGVMEENEAGEMIPRKKVQSGPWKMVSSQAEPEPQPVQPVVERQKKTETVREGSYVPPHLRDGGRPKESSHTPLVGSRLKNRAAPDINNETFFPTLNAAKTAEPAGAWGKKKKSKSNKKNKTEYSSLEVTDLFKSPYPEISNHSRSEEQQDSNTNHSQSPPGMYRHPYADSSFRPDASSTPTSQPYRPPYMNRSEESTTSSSQQYRPPHLNRSNATSSSYSSGGNWRRDDGGNFEEVRNSKSHSGRGYADVANKTSGAGGPKLNLGNKYDALDDHDQS